MSGTRKRRRCILIQDQARSKDWGVQSLKDAFAKRRHNRHHATARSIVYERNGPIETGTSSVVEEFGAQLIFYMCDTLSILILNTYAIISYQFQSSYADVSILCVSESVVISEIELW